MKKIVGKAINIPTDKAAIGESIFLGTLELNIL